MQNGRMGNTATYQISGCRTNNGMFQEAFESYLGVYDESGRGKVSSKKLIGGTSWRLDSTSQNVGIYSPKFQKFRMVWNLIFLYFLS